MTFSQPAHMLESLLLDPSAAGGYRVPPRLEWLERSYREPRKFFRVLAKAHSGKSIPFDQYDFYYDIFEYQGNSGNRPAYIYYDAAGRRHTLSYGDLKKLTDRKAAQWAARGARPGQVVCLVYPLGPEFLVGVLAALKLGMVFSFLSPARPWLLKRQMAALAPDYISTSAAYAALVHHEREKHIESMPETTPLQAVRSWDYPSGSPSARLFDFSLEDIEAPVEISCDDLFLNGLRDGMIALDLGPNDVLAYPGGPLEGVQPFLLLSVLLAGAAFQDVKPAVYRRNPQVLSDPLPTVLGMDEGFRDFLLARPIDVMSRVKFWFRPPASEQDPSAWQSFITEKELRERYTGVVKWHTQAGGLLAFSRRRKGMAVEQVMPSAGLAWQTMPLPQSGMLPSDRFGLLCITTTGGTDRETPYLFVRSQVEYLMPGSYVNEKSGKSYPEALVASFIGEAGLFRHFLLIPNQRPGAGGISRDLAVFAGSNPPGNVAGLRDRLMQAVTKGMGREYCPDRLVVLPLLPRLLPDGTMDRAWCEKKYTANQLTKLAGNSLFSSLSRLKEMILVQTGFKPFIIP